MFLDPEREYKIAFDPDLMKVGCVVVQAGVGGDSIVCNVFETRHWITHPSEGMKGYTMTGEQIERLAAMLEETP
jgi:hypothetical protein